MVSYIIKNSTITSYLFYINLFVYIWYIVIIINHIQIGRIIIIMKKTKLISIFLSLSISFSGLTLIFTFYNNSVLFFIASRLGLVYSRVVKYTVRCLSPFPFLTINFLASKLTSSSLTLRTSEILNPV